MLQWDHIDMLGWPWWNTVNHFVLYMMLLVALGLPLCTQAELATCTVSNPAAPGCCTTTMPSEWVYDCTCAAGYYRTTWSTVSAGEGVHGDTAADWARAGVTTTYADCTACAEGTSQFYDSHQVDSCYPCPAGRYASGACPRLAIVVLRWCCDRDWQL